MKLLINNRTKELFAYDEAAGTVDRLSEVRPENIPQAPAGGGVVEKKPRKKRIGMTLPLRKKTKTRLAGTAKPIGAAAAKGRKCAKCGEVKKFVREGGMCKDCKNGGKRPAAAPAKKKGKGGRPRKMREEEPDDEADDDGEDEELTPVEGEELRQQITALRDEGLNSLAIAARLKKRLKVINKYWDPE